MVRGYCLQNMKVSGFRYISACTAFLCIASLANAQNAVATRPDLWATKVQLGSLENSYMIADGFFRSEQPSRKNMLVLDSAGIKTLVNLRSRRNDKHKARKTNLQLVHVPINAWRMDYDDVVTSLRAIKAAQKPVVLHCIHGSDRTGVVAACYRMTEQGWTKEDAIDEFLNGGYGYHSGWFPKILTLLKEMDVDKLKADVAK
jgi:tyrosine-protein phosphatase SIW14